LWEALERDLLAPFHYFGIADNTDLSSLEWKRGGYDLDALDTLYTGNDARVVLVLKELRRHVSDLHAMKALGFCVSQAHAHYMAQKFTAAGIPSIALDANSPSDVRAAARGQLQSGAIQCIFTVDLFNEGVDIPEVDTVLFLRPTESATVFLQQLGRGLRHAPGKACLTVLDFIGAQHQKFRFDVRYRALTGATRSGLIQDIEEGFPYLPSGCSMQLDRVAQAIVLANVRGQLRLTRRSLANDLASYGDVALETYLADSGRDLPDVYANGGSFTDLRRRAGFDLPAPLDVEAALLKRLHRFAQVDDTERIDHWIDWLSDSSRFGELTAREERLLGMLVLAVWPNGGGHASLQEGLEALQRQTIVRDELVDLLRVARRRISHIPVALDADDHADVPLWVHCRYSREELLSGLGSASLERVPTSDMQGVRNVPGIRSDAFTFTLHKTERNYSPTTLYRDYVMSHELVHWESQSTTSVESPTGQRYLNHRRDGTHILLFARETERDDFGTRPFLFLGPATYVQHEGSRPIQIVWRLQHPMPADFYGATSVVAS
jgi:hypothetical protein